MYSDNNIYIDLYQLKDGEEVACPLDELPRWRNILSMKKSLMGLALEDGKVTIVNKKEFILRKKQERLSYKAIGEILGLSKQRTEQIARSSGPIEKTKWSNFQQEWKILYKMGMTMEEIAKKYGTIKQTVNYQLKKIGVNIRETGRKKKKLFD